MVVVLEMGELVRQVVLFVVVHQRDCADRFGPAEFQLLERVLISGFQDSRGIYGGALIFRIEFE